MFEIPKHMDDWTFYCRVCKKERLGRDISVYKGKVPDGHFHVNYCNDNKDCLNKASEMAREFVEAWPGSVG